jgi:hypothetical protein
MGTGTFSTGHSAFSRVYQEQLTSSKLQKKATEKSYSESYRKNLQGKVAGKDY